MVKRGNEMKQMSWEEAKAITSKNHKSLTGAHYWKKVSQLFEAGFPMLSGGTSDDIVKDLAQQATQDGVNNPDKVAQSAVELASNKMPTSIQPNSPEYTPMLKGLASEYVGKKDDANPNANTSLFTKNIAGSSSMFGENYKSVEQIYEDNVYQRTSVVVQNTGSDITIYNKDKFDFSLSSNKINALALAIENGSTFEVKLRVVTKSSPLWPAPWKALEQKGIDSVLKISIEGLRVDSQNMASDEDKDISSSYFDSLAKTVSKILETYNKLWGKTHYQVVAIGTNKDSKIPLIMECADTIKKLSGFSIKTDLTEDINKGGTAQWRDYTWIALKNSSGKAFKEEVSSDAFIDAVPENATVIGTPASAINAKAKKNMNRMKRKGFSAQLESADVSVTGEKETNRTYYLKLPDGQVSAFDNKEDRDDFKAKYPHADSILAGEFFDALLANEDRFSTEDTLFFKDLIVPISTHQDDIKAKVT